MCDIGRGFGGGQGQGAKNIHYQIDVNQLNWVKYRLLPHAVADHDNDDNRKVAGDLELKESLHIHEKVTAPHDSSHN